MVPDSKKEPQLLVQFDLSLLVATESGSLGLYAVGSSHSAKISLAKGQRPAILAEKSMANVVLRSTLCC